MRRDLRESAGLGSPPANFTTNASESLNAAIKRKVDFKESDWPEFISHMNEYVESQREEVIRSLSGRGQYRLCSDVAHYGVPAQTWIKVTSDQRREVASAFEKAKLPRRAVPETENYVKASIASETLASNSEITLSVSAKDSGIVSIPLVTLTAMWNKASELLSAQNAITPAPGNNSKARMVLSRSQDDILYHIMFAVTLMVSTYVITTVLSGCRVRSVLAVAEQNSELKFHEWYVKRGQGPNLSSLADYRKAGVRKVEGQKDKGQGSPLQLLIISPFDPAWRQLQLLLKADI